MAMTSVIRKTNIQGDIWPGLPKRFQTFLFFRIRKPDQFKTQLKAFVPEITTAETASAWKDAKKREKKLHPKDLMPGNVVPSTGINISFSAAGLAALGKFTFEEAAVKKDKKLSAIFRERQLRGGLFSIGMHQDLVYEGWDDPRDLREAYKPFGEKKERLIDGVILVTSNVERDMVEKVNRVKEHFLKESDVDPDTYILSNDPVVEFPLVRIGTTRPDGKEHFGFKDGISQPNIEGLDDTPKGREPKAVKPGMIFSGYEGDEMGQPDWATDGSFMVIRDLQQLVPEFDKFMEDNAHRAPFAADSPNPKEKLAAYIMGRWKNGTPVDVSPHDDKAGEPEFHAANDFDFQPVDRHDKCPFGAHIRKMRPRGDLNDDHAVIIRRGISYGGDVTPEERAARKSDGKFERGLIFVCYQSDIRNGFNFLTTRWASNNHFPDKKTKYVGEHGPGLDGIVGQRLSHHPPRSLGLPDGNEPSENRIELDNWVIHRGGEYFFSPSIEALREYFTGPPDYPELEGGS
ncbi:Peroxidase [Lachnellula subtilissima]|uniref:Peroxidase n=1 Tax=Lachnellula subtilissima TaxID=602034 RepID=A0A8H8UG16_9HELO|nr:Peroxidase [Lachnellula subtilissima]